MENGIYVLYLQIWVSCIKGKLHQYVFDLAFCDRFVRHVLSHRDFFPLSSGRLFFIDLFTLYGSSSSISRQWPIHIIECTRCMDWRLSDNERRVEGRIELNWEARKKKAIWWKKKGRKAKLAAWFLFFTREKWRTNKKVKMFEKG